MKPIVTEAMIDRGVAFALQVKIDGDYGWSEYVRDLYLRMQSASPHAVDMPLPHPTEAMIEAAEEAYMPFGDMGFALMAAYAAAPAAPEAAPQAAATAPVAPDVAGLVEALGSMTCAYRMAVQAGHARITALGGDCDSVERMLADFPEYGRAVELYKSCRAALAAHQSGGAK